MATVVPPAAEPGVPRHEYLTADEYLAHPLGSEPGELVGGRIRLMSPAGGPHHTLLDNLYVPLANHVRAHRLGRTLPDNVGYDLTALLPPRRGGTVRSPDLSFVRADRIPPGGFRRGFIRLAPDLAVEVISPDETAADLAGKVADYLAAGTRLVWVIEPDLRTVTVHASDRPSHVLREGDAVDGGAVVPGFSIPVDELFDEVWRDE